MIVSGEAKLLETLWKFSNQPFKNETKYQNDSSLVYKPQTPKFPPKRSIVIVRNCNGEPRDLKTKISSSKKMRIVVYLYLLWKISCVDERLLNIWKRYPKKKWILVSRTPAMIKGQGLKPSFSLYREKTTFLTK